MGAVYERSWSRDCDESISSFKFQIEYVLMELDRRVVVHQSAKCKIPKSK